MPSRKKPTKGRKSNNRNRSTADAKLRRKIIDYFGDSHAHVNFAEALKDFPPEARGVRPPGAPHTAWQLLEHMRIAQWDILEFSRAPKHASPDFPSGYWPVADAPPNAEAWNKSVRAYLADSKAMQRLIRNPKIDLLARIPHGQGQTLLREALAVMDHGAYHLGQLVMLSKMLGAWRE
jgi:DinB superfamily